MTPIKRYWSTRSRQRIS